MSNNSTRPTAMMIQRDGPGGSDRYRVFYPSGDGREKMIEVKDWQAFRRIRDAAGKPSYQDGNYWAYEGGDSIE